MKADVGIMAAADTAAGTIKEMNVERTMKKTVICFGDSNTFGYIPDGSGRFSSQERWPGRLQELLGDEYLVAEEGVCGRTTIFREKGNPGICGLDCVEDALNRNQPADIVRNRLQFPCIQSDLIDSITVFGNFHAS